ncbi:TIGR01906 family membrane protein [Lacticaseibacillus pabuli]|uniref:TIGR01906 family membrane protein n=1 Tax=Lacticaseibacillus pabuli TaxID=3025672 RepID=UPI0030103896
MAIPLFALWAHFEDLMSIAGMGFGRLMHNFMVLLGYLYAPWIQRVHMPDFPDSLAGATHFADVQHLFIFNLIVLVITIVPALRFIRRLVREHKLYTLRTPAIWGILVPVALGAAMAVNFDAVFIGFHKLLFRNSDWLFDPNQDPIINVLPEGYFAACFVIALLLFMGALAWVLIRGRKDARL